MPTEKKYLVYKYTELSDDAKQKAINGLSDINVDYEWWDSIYGDAGRVKLTIAAFDLHRTCCEGGFIDSAEDTANGILSEHGEHCETYTTANNYLVDRATLVQKYSDGDDIEKVSELFEYEFDRDCETLDEEFLQSILEDYRIILSNEYDYLTSEEAIIETIEANDYDFTEDGKLD